MRGSSWFMAMLADVAEAAPAGSWVGAGVVRDLVWDSKFGAGFDPARVKDVDVGFFDPADLSAERDAAVESALRRRRPDVVWDAKNQAAVHLWYPARFGVAVESFASAADAVATFPEFAACVAVRLAHGVGGGVEVCAPHGLDDLLDGVWRRNPTRVTAAEYERRLAAKRPERRWPGVRVG